MATPDTIQIFVTLKLRKKNGRPQSCRPPITGQAKIRRRTRTSCAPSVAHGDGDDAWRRVSLRLFAIWQSP